MADVAAEDYMRLAEGTVAPISGAHVQFYKKLKLNEQKTKEESRPVADELVYVRIFTPGDRTSIVDRPMKDDDKFKYPQQYAAYQNGTSQETAAGTPLQAWGRLNDSKIFEYNYAHIKTVDQLAAVTDANLGNLPIGAREDREAARNFLAAAKGAAPIGKLEEDLKAMREENARLAKILAEQGEYIDAQKKNQKQGK